jgi:hypothetical protein
VQGDQASSLIQLQDSNAQEHKQLTNGALPNLQEVQLTLHISDECNGKESSAGPLLNAPALQGARAAQPWVHPP